jgi:Zn-dependent protease
MGVPEITPELLTLGLGWWMVFVFSTTLHEAAHAFASWRLGDPTAYHGGQVTLNPTPHIQRSPFGMVVVPLISFMLNGWMLGWASAPYDSRWADRYPKRAAIMALAGPASNLLLLLLAALLIRVGLGMGHFEVRVSSLAFHQLVIAPEEGIWRGVATILSLFFSLNLLLFVFNLLPVPPLDGSAAMPLLLPDRMAWKYLEFIRNPNMAFMGLFIAWSVFGRLFSPLFGYALDLLYAGVPVRY